MMLRLRWLSISVCLAVAALVVSESATPVHAQGKGGGDANVMLPRGGTDGLKKRVQSPEYRAIWAALFKGERPYTPADKEVIDTAAQWFVYRVTWIEYHEEATKEQPGKLDLLVKEFERDLIVANKKETRFKTEQFIQNYGKQVLETIKDVLHNDRAIARINAARMLSRLAGYGIEETGDLLAETLNDPKQIDAVKFWTLRGLASYFNLTRGENRIRIRDEERQKRCIQALLAYFNRKPSAEILAYLNRKVDDEKEPTEEEELVLRPHREELAAFRYVRRENLRALAETRNPALIGKDKKPLPDADTALSVLKLLRNDGVVPEPDLAEQVEAAIAICQLEPELMPLYQSDYAAYHVGRFLVDFIQRSIDERQHAKEPWKVHAARLAVALEEFRNNARRSDGREYVNALVTRAKPMLDTLEKGQTPRPAELNAWLGQNPPKSPSLYRGVETSVLKTAEKPAE